MPKDIAPDTRTVNKNAPVERDHNLNHLLNYFLHLNSLFSSAILPVVGQAAITQLSAESTEFFPAAGLFGLDFCDMTKKGLFTVRSYWESAFYLSPTWIVAKLLLKVNTVDLERGVTDDNGMGWVGLKVTAV